MTLSKLRILLNPGAGSVADVMSVRESARKIVPTAEIVCSEEPGDICRLAREAAADGCDAVVAAGGDGTLNEVLNGAFQGTHSVRLGLLPLGTGNDFARSANIPSDLEHALAVLREGHAIPVDVVRVSSATDTRFMLNVSAGGFSSKISELANGGFKETWGSLGYARSLISALPELTSHRSVICLDDKEVLDTEAYNVVVANGRYVAGGLPIAPLAEIDDGLVDLIVLTDASLGDLATVAPSTLLGKHLGHDRILFRRARKIHVSGSPPMRFNVDGELLPPDPLTFEVLPRAVEFIVGPGPVREQETRADLAAG